MIAERVAHKQSIAKRMPQQIPQPSFQTDYAAFLSDKTILDEKIQTFRDERYTLSRMEQTLQEGEQTLTEKIEDIRSRTGQVDLLEA